MTLFTPTTQCSELSEAAQHRTAVSHTVKCPGDRNLFLVLEDVVMIVMIMVLLTAPKTSGKTAGTFIEQKVSSIAMTDTGEEI